LSYLFMIAEIGSSPKPVPVAFAMSSAADFMIQGLCTARGLASPRNAYVHLEPQWQASFARSSDLSAFVTPQAVEVRSRLPVIFYAAAACAYACRAARWPAPAIPASLGLEALASSGACATRWD
jgi:hypothetical protein